MSANVASMAIKAAPFIVGTTMPLSLAIAVPVILIGGGIAYKCNEEAIVKVVKDAVDNVKDKIKGPPSPGGSEPPKSDGGGPPNGSPLIPILGSTVNNAVSMKSKTVSKNSIEKQYRRHRQRLRSKLQSSIKH